MSRQLALGAIIGFALAVLVLALWERPAGQAAAMPDAGAPPAERVLPTLQLRGEPVPMTGRAFRGAPKVLVDGADGGP